MKSQTIQVQVKVRIIDISVIESQLKAPLEPMKEGAELHYVITLNHLYSLENKQVGVTCNVRVFDSVKEVNLYAQIKAIVSFYIEEIEEFLEGEEFKIPGELVNQLNGITVSTCRGLLFNLVKGSTIGNAVLPLINVTQKESH